MKRNYYIYPTLSKKGSLNPYLTDFSHALSEKANVVNADRDANYPMLDLIKSVRDSDVYIFNWIENLPFRRYGRIQAAIFLLFVFPFLKLRKARIYWVFHNFSSHEGKSYFSDAIKKLMLRQSDVIITHSYEAFEYLRLNTVRSVKTLFVNHPIKKREIPRVAEPNKYDILIWGSIMPYKGIVEFLQYLKNVECSFKVKIVGKCKDEDYVRKIDSLTTNEVSFENRIVPFEELGCLVRESRFVLFPYLKQSVSSSGALMDTLSFGGSPIGPARGAFLDMERDGLCYTFDSYNDILDIVEKKSVISFDRIEKFISENTWGKFAEKLLSIEVVKDKV